MKLTLDKEENPYMNRTHNANLGNNNNNKNVNPVTLSNNQLGIVNMPVIPQTSNQINEIRQIQDINTRKRTVSKFVEVTTKVTYTFEDGTNKEVVSKDNHTYSNI